MLCFKTMTFGGENQLNILRVSSETEASNRSFSVPLPHICMQEIPGDKSQSKAELRDSGAFYDPTGILRWLRSVVIRDKGGSMRIKQDALEMSRMFDLANSKD